MELFQPWHMVLILLLSPIYFLPCIIAAVRKTDNIVPITLVNAIVGWTGIGWLGALIWAITSKNPAQKAKDALIDQLLAQQAKGNTPG